MSKYFFVCHRKLISAVALSLIITAPAFAGDEAANLRNGSAVFHGTCIACHGADGKGVTPGAPDFTKANSVLSLPDKVLEDRIEHGYRSESSPMAMPPKGGYPSLTKADIHNVLAYMRKTFEKE